MDLSYNSIKLLRRLWNGAAIVTSWQGRDVSHFFWGAARSENSSLCGTDAPLGEEADIALGRVSGGASPLNSCLG